MIYTDEELYERCLALARKSPCQKLGFGAILMHMDTQTIVTEAFNRPLIPLANLCEPDCIRFDIPSRTQSMLGACGHAEESCLWQAIKTKPTLSILDCQMYVQGVDREGNALTKTGGAFTCIRCATQMYMAGILGVNVWHEDKWKFIPTDKALQQAKLCAIGAMEVDSK